MVRRITKIHHTWPTCPCEFLNKWMHQRSFWSSQLLQADSGQLYSSAMQGLSSYANNIMGHTMNQYAAQSSLLSTQVVQVSHFRPIQSLLICSLQISPVNNNISKTGGGSFPSSGGTPPPTPTHGMSSGQTAGGEISWICNKTLLLRKTLQLGGMASLTNVVTKFFLTKLTFQGKKKL